MPMQPLCHCLTDDAMGVSILVSWPLRGYGKSLEMVVCKLDSVPDNITRQVHKPAGCKLSSPKIPSSSTVRRLYNNAMSLQSNCRCIQMLLSRGTVVC